MSSQLDGLAVAVLLERGVNEIEFHYSRLRMREAGAEVVVVGNQQLDYIGENHGRTEADLTIDQVDATGFDGVVIPGGLAPEKLRQNPMVVSFVRALYERGKVCAAICHGQQVLISAGLLKGRKAVSAWSMVDDLIYAGGKHDPEARAVRDDTLVTARLPFDLPKFCSLVLEAFAEVEKRPGPDGYGGRLLGKTFGIVVDDATNDVQVFYPQYRIQEEGGTALLLGRQEGATVRLGNATCEWADNGGHTATVDKALDDMAAVDSHDFPYEEKIRAVRASQLDGLIVPGGLGTWMVRGHPGLKNLVQVMDADNKPIVAIERGPKILLSAGVLSGRTVTCSAEMRDDLIAAGIDYRDEPLIHDGNLLTCQGTEDLPRWGRVWMEGW
ncbi:DJ-1/PfpI/YhbO family deglycase/protease [Chloroflexota bacterium]